MPIGASPTSPILTFTWSEQDQCYALKFDNKQYRLYYKSHVQLFLQQIKQIPRDLWEYVGEPEPGKPIPSDCHTWYIAEQKFNDVKQLIEFFFGNLQDPKTKQWLSLPYDGPKPSIVEKPPTTASDSFNNSQQFTAFHSIAQDLTFLCDLFNKIIGPSTNGHTYKTPAELKALELNYVKKLYFKTSKILHPDLNPNNIERAVQMSQLNEVYTRLKMQNTWRA